jgi:threonylcarbamoyladenosine tRNA methylthiotransferase MtaB
MPKAAVLEQVRRLESHGYREVVLTGIDLGSWGQDSDEGALADLLKCLMGGDNPDGEEADDLPQHRYRLSSVEPLEVDDSLIEVVESSGDLVARHFHLPLQSGADSVLARMGRPYSGAQYLDVVRRLAGRLPGSALGADVIVGFPGETEREFDQTLSLVEASPLTYLHVFGYSDRPGTRAAAMGPKVPPEVIKVRSERLRSLGARKKAAFRATVAGSAQVALVLDERASDGRMVGLTGNYVKVLVEGATTLVNRFVRVRLERSLEDGRWESTLIETQR